MRIRFNKMATSHAANNNIPAATNLGAKANIWLKSRFSGSVVRVKFMNCKKAINTKTMMT